MAPGPVLYVPVLQYPGYGSSGQVLVRGRLPGLLAQAAARQVESLGRDTAISVRTLEEAGAQALAEERALAALAAFVGAMALVLAGTGLFGLISYATGRRRRDMGIRLALGATRSSIGRLVVGQTLRLTSIGMIAGLPCALTVGPILASRLQGVGPHDALTLVLVCFTLAVLGVLAAYVPATRAMGVAPAEGSCEATRGPPRRGSRFLFVIFVYYRAERASGLRFLHDLSLNGREWAALVCESVPFCRFRR